MPLETKVEANNGQKGKGHNDQKDGGKKKTEKQLAKEQDQAFLEYRKGEILKTIKPTNKMVFNTKQFDEKFPKLDMTKMDFGYKMSSYLRMRPNARYAVWPGQRKVQQPQQQQQQAASPTGLVAKTTAVLHTTKGGGGKETKKQQQDKMEKSKKVSRNIKKDIENNLKAMQEEEDDDDNNPRKKQAYSFMDPEDVDKKNHYSMNAMGVNAKAFWLESDPAPENEDDTVVDATMIAEFALKPEKERPKMYDRNEFHVWGPLTQLAKHLDYCAKKKFVIDNTLNSTVAAATAKDKKMERKDNSTPAKVSFNSATSFITYKIDTVPVEKTAIEKGKLQNIQRKPSEGFTKNGE